MSDNKHTITLQSVVNLGSTHLDLIPLCGVGGLGANEPALSLCNDALSELMTVPLDWPFNRVEMPMFVTATAKQDYLFAGATAFTLGATSTGAAIELATNNGITESGTTVTVKTLEPHRFSVGNTVYMTGNTVAAYNSTYSDDGTKSGWSGGWAITATPTPTSFTFTHASSGLATSGAPGITNFGWLSSGSMQELNNTCAGGNVRQIQAVRELPVWSKVAHPEKACVLADNNNGVLKIRLYHLPGNTAWSINLVYQAEAPLKTALTDTWSPFPDAYSAVYRQAFLYRCYRYINSPRADAEYQKLQQQILKALGAADRGSSDVYLDPSDGFFDLF